MRVRVLYTNNQKTVDLFWLSHDGKNVYCGSPGIDRKRSYHESGKVHTTSGGEKSEENWNTPLDNLKGQFHLTTIGLTSSAEWFNVVLPKFEYSGKKSDALLVIDSRSIPEGTWLQILIGLLEPGITDVLRSIILSTSEVEGIEYSVRQVLLSTAVEPWVYVILYW